MAASRVWIIILAAGYSRRIGLPKILLPYRDGSLVRHVAKKAAQVQSAGVMVVANAEMPEVQHHLWDLPVCLVWNERAHLGMSTSLVKGVENLPDDASAVLILLADQPEIEQFVIERVIDAYARSSAAIIQAAYSGKPGHPVLFDRKWFPHLLRITGDQGAKQLIQSSGDERHCVDVSLPPLEDIDTWEDYARVTRREGAIRERSTHRKTNEESGGHPFNIRTRHVYR
jgi:molybdenum cofactor cytidylyltransferase